MVDHSQQKLTAREMVRAHAYPLNGGRQQSHLAQHDGSTDPASRQNPSIYRGIDAQITLRASINPKGGTASGKMDYLKAVGHCEGF